ncbi:ligand-gated channel protein [Comamonas sp. 4034]|uniref:ligand-gated channel protein n=1 Tax=Comamonas sp. 4034 TaxID=3156455 RepID=UPI003D231521
MSSCAFAAVGAALARPFSSTSVSPLATGQHRLRAVALAMAAAGLQGAALAQTAEQQQAAVTVAQADTGGAAESTLATMVVTASGFEQAVEDAPASITVIPRQELEKKAYRDVTDALKDVPGVVLTGGGSSSDISIRGMGANYTLILVDGKPQNSRETRPNSDGAGIEQGWLPPLSAIERIEVVRGPMSSLYGSDAMGGVINIITRKVAKQWTGTVSAETTQQESSRSGDMYQSNFYLAGPIKSDVLGLQIYGQKSRRLEDRFVNGFNEQDSTSGTAKLTLTPNKDHDLALELGRTLQDRYSTKGKTASSTSSYSDYTRNHFALSHTGRWGFGTSTTYLQHEEVDNPSREMNVKNTEFNSQIVMPLGERNLTTVGVFYKQEKLTDNGNQLRVANPIDTLKRYQWAVFAENEWRATDQIALTAGLRMNHDQNYGTDWTPRIYGVWHATPQLSVKGGISTGFKAPNLRAAVADWGQITGGGGDPAIIRGNPNLKPEKSTSQELGLIWDNRQNFSSSLTLFNTNFKDKITEVRSCEDTEGGGRAIVTGNCSIYGTPYKFISDRVNVDEATMRGIEATATWKASDDLRLATNYTFTRSEQKSGAFAGKPLNKMPKHMLNATVDWQASSKLGVWSRVNFRGAASDYLSRTSMAKGTPSFTFMDLGVNYALSKNVKFSAGVYNLFDKRVDTTDFGAVYDGRRYWAKVTAGF